MKTSKEILKDSLALFKSRWGLFITILLTAAIANGIIQIIFPALATQIAERAEMAATGVTMIAMLIVSFCILLAGLVALLFVDIAARLAPVYVTNALEKGESVSFGQAWKHSLKRVPSYVWISILTVLVLIPAFFLFVIPGIILFIFISFAMFAFVVDGKKGLSALTYSISLMRGRAWKTIGLMVRPLLIVLAFAIVAILIAGGIIMAAESFMLSDIVVTILFIVFGIVVLPIGLIASSVLIIYSYKVYQQLKLTAPTVETADQVPGFFAKLFATESKSRTILKALAWVGVVGSVVVSSLFAYAYTSMPQFRQAFDMVMEKSAQQENRALSSDYETSGFNDYGISFPFPEGWLSLGRIGEELVTLVDTSNSPQGEYQGQIIVYGNAYDDATVGKTSQQIATQLFADKFEEGKKNGEIQDYSMGSKQLGVHDAATISFTTVAEGKTISSYWVIITSPIGFYMFVGDSIAGEAALVPAVDTTVSQTSFVDYPIAE